ncbi:MAG: hypothetical protein OXD39_00835, partial [Gemmatimonadetes bacterium]|nr:hypothetical protein [Gemmatimonadota bacterium]
GVVALDFGVVGLDFGVVAALSGATATLGAAAPGREEFVGLSFPQVNRIMDTRQRTGGNPSLAIRDIGLAKRVIGLAIRGIG